MSKRYVLYTNNVVWDYYACDTPQFREVKASNLDEAIEVARKLLEGETCANSYTEHAGLDEARLYEVTATVDIHSLLFGPEEKRKATAMVMFQANLKKVQAEIAGLAEKMVQRALSGTESYDLKRLQDERSKLESKIQSLNPATNG